MLFLDTHMHAYTSVSVCVRVHVGCMVGVEMGSFCLVTGMLFTDSHTLTAQGEYSWVITTVS